MPTYPQEIRPSATRVESPDSLRAMLRFSSKKAGIKGRAALTIKNPDLIRVEVYGALGQILTVVAGDSKNCSVYSKGVVKQCAWNDPAIPGLISPADLVPILLGKGELAFPDSKQRQSFSDNFDRLTQIITGQSNKAVHITIGDYRIAQGLRLPFSFTIQSKTTTGAKLEEELKLDYYKVTPNPPIQQSTFNLGSTMTRHEQSE